MRGTALVSVSLIALVGLGGCGKPSPAGNEAAAKPAAQPSAEGPYGREHQAEAIALAARTAGNAQPGRLDLAHPIAAFTTLSLAAGGGPGDGERVPGWMIAFPLKPSAMAQTTPQTAAGAPAPMAPPSGPVPGPAGAPPPLAIAPPGGAMPNGYQPPPQVTNAPPPTGDVPRSAPGIPQPPAAAMASAPPARPGAPGGPAPMPGGSPPPMPGGSPPPMPGAPMPGGSPPPMPGAPPMPGPGTAPMPASAPPPTSPIGCTVYVTIDGRSQVLPPQH
jgi:hypothetical protein